MDKDKAKVVSRVGPNHLLPCCFIVRMEGRADNDCTVKRWLDATERRKSAFDTIHHVRPATRQRNPRRLSGVLCPALVPPEKHFTAANVTPVAFR